MVRGFRPGDEKKKKKPKIGDAEFQKLPAAQQKRIRELASDKPLNELSTTVKDTRKNTFGTAKKGDQIPKGKPKIKEKEKSRFEMAKDLGKEILEGPSMDDFKPQELDPQVGADLDKSAIGGLSLGITATGAQALSTTIKTAATQAAIRSGFKQQARAITGQTFKETGTNAVINTRFPVNTKVAGLSSKILNNAGLSIGASSILLSVIGSYPFAGFIKEEALQTLGFATNAAKQAGDLEGQQEAIDQVNEVLNPTAWDKVFASIPFANVVKQLREFYSAAATKNDIDQKSLYKQIGIQKGNIESDFAKERRKTDEAAQQRQNEQRGLDAEYFKLLRENKFEEAEEFRIINFPT